MELRSGRELKQSWVDLNRRVLNLFSKVHEEALLLLADQTVINFILYFSLRYLFLLL